MLIELPPQIAIADPQDWRLVGDIIGDAFEEDPLVQWILRTPRAVKPMFQILARDIYLRNGFVHTLDDNAASLWAMHDASTELTTRSTLSFAASHVWNGAWGTLRRGYQVDGATKACRPKAPHLYLFAIGTRRARQGRGLGSALIAPVLDAADRERLPVYLENSNPVNLKFYEARGGEITDEIVVSPGAPPFWTMWRNPR